MSVQQHVTDLIEHARASVARVGLVVPRFVLERADGRVMTSTLPVPSPPADGPERDAWFLQRCDTRVELMAALALQHPAPGDVFVACGMSWLKADGAEEEPGCLITAGFVMPGGAVRPLEGVALVLETQPNGTARLREPQPINQGADSALN